MMRAFFAQKIINMKNYSFFLGVFTFCNIWHFRQFYELEP